MNSQKFLLGGIIGGIIYFLLGWLLYGNLLSDFMKDNAGIATNVEREMPVFWSLILGNLLFGFLLSYIFIRLSSISSAGSGLVAGAAIGLLMGAGFDFTIYGTSNLANLTGIFADIATVTVISAIAGAGVGWVAGRGRRPVNVS